MASAQCCENAPTLLASSCGAGHVEDFRGLKTYISGSPHSKLGILLVSDVYVFACCNSLQLQEKRKNGWGMVKKTKPRKKEKLADKVAAVGFFVVVPDFFHGEPLIPNNPDRPFQAWIKDHSAEKASEDAKPVIEALKKKGVSKIGVAAFCWGAKVAVILAKHACINVAVLLHPSFVTLDDIQGVEVPISILGAEIDQLSPPELLEQFDQVLKAKNEAKTNKSGFEVDAFVKIYPGVSHGWTVKYNSEDAEAAKRAEEAHKDMLDWFVKYIC
ncbi:unnamed protein product [Camellia sinensis]